MSYRSTIFCQLLRMLPRKKFDIRVQQEQADHYTKHFTAWNQLLVNLYAQVNQMNSLRDIETGMKVLSYDGYHLGLTHVARSTLAYANQRRDPMLFEQTFYDLLAKCRELSPQHRFKFKNPLYALDSTVIELCLSVFPWAQFRKAKGALKIHSLLDLRGTLPAFLVVSDGKTHDVKVAQKESWPLSPDSILVVDKAYLDFQWLNQLHSQGVFFVLRSKDNMKYQVLGQHNPPKNKAIINDLIIRLTGFQAQDKYPDPLRLVTYYDEQENRVFTYLTNNLALSPMTIAQIYKARWQIELFFKWIKQHLKIKTFLGTSLHAVLTQIWTAMIYYLLLSYIKFKTSYRYSLLVLARIFRQAAFQYLDIIDLLDLNPSLPAKPPEPDPQLYLFN